MPTFSIFDILVGGPVLSCLKMIGIANVFFCAPPILPPSRFLKFSHLLTAVYFPPCSPISRLLLPLYTPLLQFKLKTGIMRKVMGRRQRRGKSEGVA